MTFREVEEEALLGRIGRLVGSRVGGQVDEAISVVERDRLVRAAVRTPRGRRRLWWGACLGLALAAGAGVSAWLWWGRPELSYVVEGDRVAEGGYLRGSQPEGTRVRFSDGSDVILAEGSRGRLTSPGVREARLAIESGRVTFRLNPKRTSWFVDAGPFVVRASGASFDVSWSMAEEVLVLELVEGSVVVSGPPAHTGLTLGAGQRLVAADGRLNVEPLAHDDIPAASSTWSRLLAAGDAASVIADAEARGLTACYEHGSLDELVALADAARSAGRDEIALGALGAQRARFPSSQQAAAAAFWLGRLEDRAGNTERARAWYEIYLAEAPSGPLSTEALERALSASDPDEPRN